MSVKERIEVAYDKEFEEILDRLGLKDKLVSGELHCGLCGRDLDLTNVMGVYSDRGEVLLCCDTPACAARVAEKISTTI